MCKRSQFSRKCYYQTQNNIDFHQCFHHQQKILNSNKKSPWWTNNKFGLWDLGRVSSLNYRWLSSSWKYWCDKVWWLGWWTPSLNDILTLYFLNWPQSLYAPNNGTKILISTIKTVLFLLNRKKLQKQNKPCNYLAK